MKRLIHSGVLVPKYEAKGFHIWLRGEKIALSPVLEEMAVAWVKKLGTEYVEDQTFARNFFQDFIRTLRRGKINPHDLNFSQIQQYVIDERNRRLALSREERKRLAHERKVIREANKLKYGYATVDGMRVEVGNYTVEPSSIFMGRGRHPLRGRWKQGATERDIVLNLSPDAPVPEGDWKEVVWQPDSMWIAKWRDKLQGKWKYVWLSDSSYIKQQRDIEKFDKAGELEGKLEEVRAHIMRNLTAPDLLRKKIATVCYLVDYLNLRVGDEKDTDEADTVGATTLRPEHIVFGENGLVTFDFLGKDSIRWHFEAKLPEPVLLNIQMFSKEPYSSIFKGVRSDNVSSFLDEIMPGLTAKVFRTHHATTIVNSVLGKSEITKENLEYEKKNVATLANLEAAKACNHKKKIPTNWADSMKTLRERLKKYREQKREIRAKKTRKEETKTRRLKKMDERISKLRTRIALKKATQGYNLNTSLKSYIDPRVYYGWGNEVDYDWKKYYPKAQQRKFLWVEKDDYP